MEPINQGSGGDGQTFVCTELAGLVGTSFDHGEADAGRAQQLLDIFVFGIGRIHDQLHGPNISRGCDTFGRMAGVSWSDPGCDWLGA